MEALLPSALAAAPAGRGVDFSNLRPAWQRQYAGLVRNGSRFIYGSFFPADAQNELAGWRERPMIVCDGGPQFFGAEYDVEAGRISHLAFNGSLGFR